MQRFWIFLGIALFGLGSARGAVDRTPVLREMESWISQCILRRDTTHPLFHGCVDWHSAVHGHWALFRIARATGVTDAPTLAAEKSFTEQALLMEARTLNGSFNFENPYGRSWFLRLAVDFEAWAVSRGVARPQRLRAIGGLVSRSLFTRFRNEPPTPDSIEYNNASWAMAQLQAYLNFTGDTVGLAEWSQVMNDHFLGDEALTFGQDPRGFFSVFGNWIFLVAHTQTHATLERFLAAHPILDSDLAPTSVFTAHSMGTNWSRAWALAALARETSDPFDRGRFGRAFEAHIQQGLADHARYRTDYGQYGHWVPQFAVHALTEELD